MSSLKHQIAPIYAHIVHPQILRMRPQEEVATCDDCIMAKKPIKGEQYKANLKCCTFHPITPNFIIGSLLQNKDFTQGRKIVEAKIQSHEWTLPIGILPPLQYQVQFNNKKKNEFGNRAEWLCPYYNTDENNCNIWQYRGSVCTSFYCKSSYGARGINFWQKFESYLFFIEMALAEEALVQLDFSPRQVSDQLNYINRKKATTSELKGLTSSEYKKIWNHYDDPKEFYIKCAQYISTLSRKNMKEILGELGSKLEEDVVEQYKKL